MPHCETMRVDARCRLKRGPCRGSGPQAETAPKRRQAYACCGSVAPLARLALDGRELTPVGV